MRIFIVMMTIFAVGFISGDAFAKKKKRKKKKKSSSEMSYDAAYGMAGCGLGSSFFKDNSKMMQILAATTNGSSYNQLFGITSGTSNCTVSKDSMALEQKVFVEMNLASLSKEAARGEGETLTAFAELLGCDHQEFRSMSRDNYKVLYGSTDPNMVLERHHELLGGQCARSS